MRKKLITKCYIEFAAKTTQDLILEKQVKIYQSESRNTRDFKSGSFSNTLVIQDISINHIFDPQHSNIIAFIHNKNKRRLIESSAISHYNTIEYKILKFHLISPKLLKDFNLY